LHNAPTAAACKQLSMCIVFCAVELSVTCVERCCAGIPELVAKLQQQGKAVFLVSGGFRQVIHPIAESLGIPLSHVYANQLLFKVGAGLGASLGVWPAAAAATRPILVKLCSSTCNSPGGGDIAPNPHSICHSGAHAVETSLDKACLVMLVLAALCCACRRMAATQALMRSSSPHACSGC
jgi:hypothetical protein